MATFISTIKFSKKSLDFGGVREAIRRVQEFTAATKELGIVVIGACWRLDLFDGIIVFEAPDDEMAAAAIRHLSKDGYLSTTVSRLEFPHG